MKKQFEYFGELWEVEKENTSYRCYHVGTHARAVSRYFKTIKEAKQVTIDVLNQVGIDKMQNAIKRYVENKAKNTYFLNKHIGALFCRYFGMSPTAFLDRTFYIVNSYRLDIVRFDTYLHTPEGISMKDFIQQKYGKTALKLVQKLM